MGYEVRKTVNDKLRDFIIWSIEAYEVSAFPPAVNYSKRVDPSYRDDVNGYSRAYLLRLAIDTKSAFNGLLANLPRNRAVVLMGWVITTEQSYYHSLSDKQKYYLKKDRKTLKMRLKGENR